MREEIGIFFVSAALFLVPCMVSAGEGDNKSVVNEWKTVLGHEAIVWDLQLVLGSWAWSVGEVVRCTFILGEFGWVAQ